MVREKRKRIDSGDLAGVTMGEGESMSLSIGSLLGRGENESASEKQSSSEKQNGRKEQSGGGQSSAESVSAYLKAARASTKRETAGRGSKVVTIVTLRPWPPADLAKEIARTMRKDFGCGSQIEGESIVLSGDMRERVDVWLRSRTAKA